MAELVQDIALCDDDELFLDSMKKQILSTMQAQGKNCHITRYQSAQALLADLRGGRHFSLLMLDVMMEGLDGMALARTLRESDKYTPIILISCNRDYALTGYELDVLRFLAKPIDPSRLREALNAAEAKAQKQIQLFRNAEGVHRVDVSGIAYAEVWERGVMLHLSDGKRLSTATRISELEELLPQNDFFRCHQGYIVNLAYIRRLQPTDALLNDGSLVPVSRYKRAELRTRFTNYLNQ